MPKIEDARRIELAPTEDGETAIYGYFGDNNERIEIARSHQGMLAAYLNAYIVGVLNGTYRLRNADNK